MLLQLPYEQAASIQSIVIHSVSNSAKRCCSHNKKTFFDVKYPEETSDMVSPCTTLSKFEGKQPVVCSSESNNEPSSSLKEILSESEEVY